MGSYTRLYEKRQLIARRKANILTAEMIEEQHRKLTNEIDYKFDVRALQKERQADIAMARALIAADLK